MFRYFLQLIKNNQKSKNLLLFGKPYPIRNGDTLLSPWAVTARSKIENRSELPRFDEHSSTFYMISACARNYVYKYLLCLPF